MILFYLILYLAGILFRNFYDILKIYTSKPSLLQDVPLMAIGISAFLVLLFKLVLISASSFLFANLSFSSAFQISFCSFQLFR